VNHPLHPRVRAYYDRTLQAHGPTPAGVDWNSLASQQLRFAQLARLWDGEREGSLLDVGCGYGALLPWLRGRNFDGPYVGFDLSAQMIQTAIAAATSSGLNGWRFLSERSELTAVDFVVASGIFNVRMDTDDADWHDYMISTIDDLAALARRGFAFNALTAYSDPDKQRQDLYYADPLAIFDYCKRNHSPLVTLVHDYPLYEFTMIVRRPQ
jgi:SAM-dependent methyltransferase